MLTIEEILEARERIRPEIHMTPLLKADYLTDLLGFPIFLKDETRQKTGAFKYRGVMNFLLSTPEVKLSSGVITGSSGNHGKAMSTAAAQRGISATVVLPDTAPRVKVEALREVKARIVFSEPQKRLQTAQKIAEEEGLLFIHPFNDLLVIGGQASIGLEILDQFPDTERIVVPMGGGGLITGIATAVKLLRSDIEIVGAETLAVPKFSYNLHREKLVPTPEKPSVADAILSNMPGTNTIIGVRKYVDRIVDVSEENILKALRLLVTKEDVRCEPSSAVTLGALLQENFSEKKTVLVISGGNVSAEQLSCLISGEEN